MTRPAPIAIFVHRRPAHTRALLGSLLANPEARTARWYVFCDGPRSGREARAVAAARAAVRSMAPADAAIVESATNLGLARSVMDGVTRVVEEHGAVVVLEDDLVLSRHTLAFLNAALARYRDEPRVMHVSAYMFPVGVPLPEAFFYREATCWGWATWARAWRELERNGEVLRDAIVARSLRHELDVRGSMGFFAMLEQQLRGAVDSWAIRWYASMRLRDGLALHPGASLVRNAGFDGTGTNCGTTSRYDVVLRGTPVTALPDEIVECRAAVEAMIAFRGREAPGVRSRWWRPWR